MKSWAHAYRSSVKKAEPDDIVRNEIESPPVATPRETTEECPVCCGIKHKRGDIERMITGAIKSAVISHRPIVQENAPSAAKRVIGAMKSYLKNEQPLPPKPTNLNPTRIDRSTENIVSTPEI